MRSLKNHTDKPPYAEGDEADAQEFVGDLLDCLDKSLDGFANCHEVALPFVLQASTQSRLWDTR